MSFAIVQILGGSMYPSFEEGWRIRIEPLNSDIIPGDIIQLDIGIRPVLHRAIHVFEKENIPVVLQRGDVGGPLSIVPVSAVTGHATAIVSPPGLVFPALNRLPAEVRDRFERTGRFARFYARAWNATSSAKLRRVLDIALTLYGRKFIRVEDVVSLRLNLSEVAEPSRQPGRETREIAREMVQELFEQSGFPPQKVDDLDRVFNCPWRCFVTFSEGKAVHYRFVAFRPAEPHIFGAWTIPEHRNQGLSAEMIRSIASRLRAEGHRSLTAYSMSHNVASLTAQRNAGFRETSRRHSILLLGLSPQYSIFLI